MNKTLLIITMFSLILSSCFKGKYALTDYYQRQKSKKISKSNLIKEVPEIARIIRRVVVKHFKDGIAVFPIVHLKDSKVLKKVAEKLSSTLLDYADDEFKIYLLKDTQTVLKQENFALTNLDDKDKISKLALKYKYPLIVYGVIRKFDENEKLIIKVLDPDTQAVLRFLIYILN